MNEQVSASMHCKVTYLAHKDLYRWGHARGTEFRLAENIDFVWFS